MNPLIDFWMEKIALSPKTLNDVYSRLIKPNVLKPKNNADVAAAINLDLKEDFLKVMDEVYKDSPDKAKAYRAYQDDFTAKEMRRMGVSTPANDWDYLGEALHGKIISPRKKGMFPKDFVKEKINVPAAGGFSFNLKANPGSFLENLRFVDKDVSGKSRETLNRLAGMHELAELQVGKKEGKRMRAQKHFFSGADDYLPRDELMDEIKNFKRNVSSHVSPEVLLREHNMLSKLEGMDPRDIQQVRDRFRRLRSSSGELEVLDDVIPGGFGIGERLSPSARKHLGEKYLRKFRGGN